MLFDATFIEMISAVAKELNEHQVMLVLQSLSGKHQALLPDLANVHFAIDPLTVDDFQTKKQLTEKPN